MSDAERAELRAEWYPRLARNDAQRKLYTELVATPVRPFGDARRPDSHRTAYIPRKIKRRMKDLGYDAAYGQTSKAGQAGQAGGGNAPPGSNAAGAAGGVLSCKRCARGFGSRNALFKHLRDPSNPCGQYAAANGGCPVGDMTRQQQLKRQQKQKQQQQGRQPLRGCEQASPTTHAAAPTAPALAAATTGQPPEPPE